MIGIVDVGGGNRDIYGAGVLDFCLDNNITVDYFIGVSAGSANGVSYIAKQKRRNYCFYNNYAFRKEYMSIGEFIKHGSFVNLDYIYSTLSNSDGEYPVDYDTFINNPIDLEIVACNAITGNTVYFPKDKMLRDNYHFLKASSCVPVACKPYEIHGQPFYDGGISDPIPFQRAFDKGCDKVIVILTRPKNYRRDAKKDQKLSKLIANKYPRAAEMLGNRSYIYNTSLEEAIKLEKAGKILIIAPDEVNLNTFTKDHNQLDLLYSKGYKDAEAIIKFVGD
ncbi:MAG: patatin family protein [Erysipelotrichales bacterium]|nr:patatin family protein [Erysipelotrichales bacterium]